MEKKEDNTNLTHVFKMEKPLNVTKRTFKDTIRISLKK